MNIIKKFFIAILVVILLSALGFIVPYIPEISKNIKYVLAGILAVLSVVIGGGIKSRPRKVTNSNQKDIKGLIGVGMCVFGFVVVPIFGYHIPNYQLEEVRKQEKELDIKLKEQDLNQQIESLQSKYTELESKHISLIAENDELQRKKINKDKVINAINKYATGVFKSKGAFIYEVCEQYNVNPILVTAKFLLESGWGKEGSCIRQHNPSGIHWPVDTKEKKRRTEYIAKGYYKDGWYTNFLNIDNGIRESIILLKEDYIDKGRDTIEKIGAKWAPTNDSREGMYGMSNKNWVPNVYRIYNQIKEASM